MAEAAPRVRNTVARRVLAELRSARRETAAILREAGLTKAQAEREDGWIGFESHARLLELAARELDDPYFGLNLAKRIGPRDFGALAYVGLASATLGEALNNLARYLRVHSEAWQLEIGGSGASAALIVSPAVPDFAHFAQAAEAGVGLLVNSYRQFLGGRLVPREIGFVHALGPGRKRSQIEALLGAKVAFGRNRIAITLDGRDLARSIASADDRLLKVLKAHCASVLREQRVHHAELAALVRGAIADGLSKGGAKARLVAAELGFTERSLHRKLAAEGASFGDILDTLRRGLAEDYLQENRLSTKQIAFLLGYSDSSAFGAAYRRWTGHSPRAARPAPHQPTAPGRR